MLSFPCNARVKKCRKLDAMASKCRFNLVDALDIRQIPLSGNAMVFIKEKERPIENKQFFRFVDVPQGSQ
jgi:hypothetical protein